MAAATGTRAAERSGRLASGMFVRLERITCQQMLAVWDTTGWCITGTNLKLSMWTKGQKVMPRCQVGRDCSLIRWIMNSSDCPLSSPEVTKTMTIFEGDPMHWSAATRFKT